MTSRHAPADIIARVGWNIADIPFWAAVFAIRATNGIWARAAIELVHSFLAARVIVGALTAFIRADHVVHATQHHELLLNGSQSDTTFRTCSRANATVISLRAAVLSIATADSIRLRATAVNS